MMPCPFCSSSDVRTLAGLAFVFCGSCGCRGPLDGDPVAAWDRRPAVRKISDPQVVPVEQFGL